ncbi:MAG: hypothetical protein EOQ98_31870 [Mesorhizobium sp.]|uniref:hypothetical protein n=1 Tax=Mesorhizobium sp. TaxID=1871066 RepID=UPI000FE5FE5C|nr:hypothetical protein [Mesorhizobium sp.]RWO94200.1 MAG: hypothetical protein EOQ98_31870 [Mesorhizobium sp.]
MARLSLKQRFDFDVLIEPEDRLVYALLQYMACDGHGDVGGCGVAEFDLLNLAEALDWAPGATLRRLKRIAPEVNAVCVEHENTVLFALAGAGQKEFDHLYKRRGFEGLPPNLPHVKPRFLRI